MSRSILIKNINILTMESEEILTNHDLVIEGDRVEQILPTGAVPSNADYLVLDGTDKYVLPGLHTNGVMPSPYESFMMKSLVVGVLPSSYWERFFWRILVSFRRY
ncbi:MAG: hypothetical protein ACFFE8_17300 [Candidatus Heimdallarchaeota archaeon]